MIDFKALWQTTTNRLIFVTIVVFFLVEALFAGAANTFELYSWQTPYFKIWQPFTYMFLHGGFTHLLFNMIGLWFFGQVIEKVWGWRTFLVFYVICGLGAALISQLIDHYILGEVSLRMVGASGAIYGILVAFAMLFPNHKIMLIFCQCLSLQKYLCRFC